MFSTDGAHYIVAVVLLVFVTVIVIWSEAPEILWGRDADEVAARQVVARVNGSEILRGELLDEAEARNLVIDRRNVDLASTQIREVLDEIIEQKLLAEEALERDLDDTEFGRRAIELAKDRALGELLLKEEVRKRVTEEALLRVYDAQVKSSTPNFQVQARHILLDSEDVAKTVLARLKNGEDFAFVASEVSLDRQTRDKGGSLGSFGRGEMDPAFEDVAFSTPKGEFSEPFETGLGWHIVMIDDRREQSVPSFDELRPQLLRYQTFEVVESLISQLRNQAVIDYILEDDVSD